MKGARVPVQLPTCRQPHSSQSAFQRPLTVSPTPKLAAGLDGKPPLRIMYGNSRVDDTYDILEKLGEGTFGVVTKARVKATAFIRASDMDEDAQGSKRRLPRPGELVALKRIILHNENDGVRPYVMQDRAYSSDMYT